MPSLSVRARFPLGVFQGHRSDGTPAPLPDTARLHAALANAASKGSTAVERDGDLRASAASVKALEWLETHPPDSLMLPDAAPVATGRRPHTFRDEGWRERRTRKRAAKVISTGHALAGAVGWHWDEVPTEVRDAVAALCADVGCLGEAESVVVLDVSPIEPTHHCNPDLGQLDSRGLSVRTPASGRWSALEQAYDDAHPPEWPTTKQDRPRTNEAAALSPVSGDGLRIVKYEAPGRPPSVLPWGVAIALATDAPVAARDRVEWCVALHRMLAARLGDDAPPMVTGGYRSGAPRPANGVAVQYLPHAALAHRPEGNQAPYGMFVLMLPQDLAPDERTALYRALRGRLRIYRRSGEIRLALLDELDTATFWPAPTPGWTRTWRAVPALIPDVRRQPTTSAGPWTLQDAALLSLAFVFRNDLPATTSRRDYRALVAAVRSRGAQVRDAALIPDATIARYAHKVPQSLGVVQPYRATLQLGDLASPRALLALGQSRHLGGGLLLPQDAPANDAEEGMA